jgi:hypothetical protein
MLIEVPKIMLSLLHSLMYALIWKKLKIVRILWLENESTIIEIF